MLRNATRTLMTSLAVAGIVAASGIAGAGGARAAGSDSVRGSQQWIMSMTNAEQAWQESQGAGVTVGVLDSGVVAGTSDLSGNVESGPDLSGLKTPPSNPSWGVHGTWMASIIAGHGHDGGQDGIMGIAPRAKILGIRVLPEKNDPEFSAYQKESGQRIQQSLASGIRDAVADGAKVVSMSLGYTAPSAAVRSAVQYALSRGTVLVASSGNSGENDMGAAATTGSGSLAPVSFPAEYPGVLSVAALKSDGSVASFSSNNLSVQVAAPGFNVPAQGRDGQYWLVSGTSPACAVVAGVAALIKSRYPSLAPARVLRAITSTARSTSPGSYNPQTGFGLIDAAAALRAAAWFAGQPAVSAATVHGHFGTGAASPPEPVAPRGPGPLVWFAVLAVACAAAAAAAAPRALRYHRARSEARPSARPVSYLHQGH
ncbi:MAG: S8 family serine peptidase [Streptosporangiales bacterium]|nr:S8 family serine peptidase [Streptosporangiales bacterium]